MLGRDPYNLSLPLFLIHPLICLPRLLQLQGNPDNYWDLVVQKLLQLFSGFGEGVGEVGDVGGGEEGGEEVVDWLVEDSK